MDIFVYTIIFIIGTLFGSFYTLAVWRLPRKEDITHTHSYCPNCNHKLGFFELIPILSYIFLGGKCKSCNQKIRIRYLILEVLSGILFLVIAYLLNLNYSNFKLINVISFVFVILYITVIILIAAIDKEKRKIEKSVLYYGVIISIIYIIYLCIMDNTSIYRYVICLISLILLLLIDNISLRKTAKESYIIQNVILLNIMLIFTDYYATLSTVIVTALSIVLYLLIEKLKNKGQAKIQDKTYFNKMQIAYISGIANLSFFVYQLILIKLFI